jgi:hypothetical protein
MANLSKGRVEVKEKVLSKCWDYINNNFNKFTPEVKVKVALELCKKDIPQEVKGDLFGSSEITQALAGLNAADIKRVINACRERTGKERPV